MPQGGGGRVAQDHLGAGIVSGIQRDAGGEALGEAGGGGQEGLLLPRREAEQVENLVHGSVRSFQGYGTTLWGGGQFRKTEPGQGIHKREWEKARYGSVLLSLPSVYPI